MGACLSLGVTGCATRHPVVAAAVLSDDAELVSTQMLKPAVEGRACGWSAPWDDADSISSRAFHRALAQAPDATLLRDARIETERMHLGVVVRDCVRVTGDATRRITQIVLPALGTGHEGHH